MQKNNRPFKVGPHYDKRLMDRRELRGLFPVVDMTINRWEKAGTFPERIMIHGNAYWRASEVLAWIEHQSQSEEGRDDQE